MSASSRPLGLWSATALVAGNMVGSGVFLLPASLAPYGALSLIGWAITLTGALLLALTFARLAARGAHPGGPYAYAREAFGDGAGFAIAWSYWISIWCANAALAVAFAGSVGALFPALTATPARAAACALAALALCVAVNAAGVREAGRMQVITTVLKLVPLLLFGAVAIWWIDPTLLQPTLLRPTLAEGDASSAGTSPMFALIAAAHATVTISLWSLLGLEAATIPAGAIHEPSRTIPRATLLGTAIAGIATLLACTAVLGVLPAEIASTSAAPMAEAARRLWGEPAGLGIALIAAISCLGALNGWVLLSAQLPLAAAEDGLLPRVFARRDARGTPRAGLLIGAALSAAVVLANFHASLVEAYTFAILLSTAATLLPYLLSAAAWLKLGRRGRVVAALALLYSLYALAGAGADALLWGAALLLAGAPLYWVLRRRR